MSDAETPVSPTTIRRPTLIRFRFEGGIAEQGQLSFYEAGRYRYAAARMLYTIEHFRNTGEVLERLAKIVDADFRVQAPSGGSFLEVVQHYALPMLTDFHTIQAALHIPFDKLLPYVLSKIIPKASASDRLANIAEKQADALEEFALALQEREKTAQIQAVQETERLRILESLLRKDGGGLRDNIVEAKEIGQIVSKYAATPARIAFPDGSADFIASELSAEVERESIIEEAEPELNRIAPASEQQLVDRVRKILPEVGQPLKRSAEKMELEVGDTSMRKVASLNRVRIDQIAFVERDDKSIVLHGSIIKLDKETGYGRFRPSGSRTTLSFVIPREIFQSDRQLFIDAFTLREVDLKVIPFRDGIGNIVRLILVGILPPENGSVEAA